MNDATFPGGAASLSVLLAARPAAARRHPPDIAPRIRAPRAVTGENLLASERFWPYHVELTKPWPRAGAGSRSPPVHGRLDPGRRLGLARIDFGRGGLYEVPIGATDLIDLADQVRRGKLQRWRPTSCARSGRGWSIPDRPRPAPTWSAAHGAEGFLASSRIPRRGLRGSGEALAPRRGRQGVLTVLLPTGEHPDAEVGERLARSDGPCPSCTTAPDTYAR